MGKNSNKKIAALLSGKLTAVEAQKILSKLSPKDIDEFVPKEEINNMLTEYQENCGQKVEKAPYLSEEQIKERWRKVQLEADSNQSINFLHEIGRAIHKFLNSLIQVPLRYSVVSVAVLLVVCISPYLSTYLLKLGDSHIGMKGDVTSPKAIVQIAIAGNDFKLHRLNRDLEENDTIAFRVNAMKDGYCSIYITYDTQIDKLVSDKFISEGITDIGFGYSLSGNRGHNTVVMLFSDKPIKIPEADKQKLIIESAHNRISTMTIQGNEVELSYTEFEVD